MRKFLPKSLVTQFNAIILIFMTLGICVLAVFVFFQTYQKIMYDQETKLVNTMALAKLSLQEPIWYMNSSAINDVRDAIMSDTDIVAIKITDEANIILSERKAELYTNEQFSNLIKKDGLQHRTVQLNRSDKPIGEVHIITTNSNALNLVKRLLILIITGAVIAIISLGAAINVLGNRFLKRPVVQLTNTAHELSKGNLDVSIDKSRKDELGVLADSFSYMRDAVREKIGEMAYLNENLEKLVTKRTEELLKANIELKEAKIVAEMANESKSEFLQNISHELRTPMHAILGFAKLCVTKVDTLSTDKISDYQEEIIAAGNRLSNLIDTLIDLSGKEGGSAEYQFSISTLSSVISQSISEVASSAEEKNITISFKPKSTDLAMAIDKEKITQVMRNILLNAVKYSPEGEEIFVQHEIGETTSRVSIIDKGIGIPDQELESIFDIFNQSTKTKTGAGGTGLGLSICRRIIDKHNGRIWANNNPDGGATITFIIPNGQFQPQMNQQPNAG